jgi:hypothetical protein
MKIRLKILGDFDFDETWPIASFVHLIGRKKNSKQICVNNLKFH